MDCVTGETNNLYSWLLLPHVWSGEEGRIWPWGIQVWPPSWPGGVCRRSHDWQPAASLSSGCSKCGECCVPEQKLAAELLSNPEAQMFTLKQHDGIMAWVDYVAITVLSYWVVYDTAGLCSPASCHQWRMTIHDKKMAREIVPEQTYIPPCQYECLHWTCPACEAQHWAQGAKKV